MRIIALTLITAAIALLVAQPVPAAPAAGFEIAFSATAEPGSFGGSGDPHYGFWIWCEASGTTPYQGTCTGSMYFYAIEIFTERVMGTATLSGQQATLQVASSATAREYINCTLTNLTVPPAPGPNNTVMVTCTNNTTTPGPSGNTTTLPNVIVAIVPAGN
jgi:hypothetical protein